MDTQFLLKFPYLSQECHFTVDSFNKDPHEVHTLHLVMSYVFFLLYQPPLFSRPLVPHFVYLLKALGCLVCRMSHILNLADCLFWYSFIYYFISFIFL